jgi:pimeloyl-ACP methyl ester carboxylesterase
MKFCKQFFALILCLPLVAALFLCPFTPIVQAADSDSYGGTEWNEDAGTDLYPGGELITMLKNRMGASVMKTGEFAAKSLSKADAALAVSLVVEYWQNLLRENWEEILREKRIVWDEYSMPFAYKVFGDKPADGRSLYISMHGGGNTAAEENDQQWRNQIDLYTPAEGVYFVPRAAVNDWDMWFQPHVDIALDMIIQTAVAALEVNPDKVYLMGYSAGGDGVYRLGTRLADRWAAASVMAGHPGEVSPVNLRNIGFMVWMGENDSAYNRNGEARTFGQLLDELQREEDGDGYIHETHLVRGKGHWMDGADKAAVPWMAQFRRNPLPEKVVWLQDDIPHNSLYWLRVPPSEAENGKLAIVERMDNTFTVITNHYNSLSIGLNDAMIDFNKPIRVIVDGEVVFNKKVRRNAAAICMSVEDRCDPGLIFSAYITLEDGAVSEYPN